MSYNSLTVEFTNHIAHIQLNRPEAMNSMNADFWQEVPQVVREIDQKAEARCIVISSTGKHFSAGMDLAIFANPDLLPSEGEPGRLGENLRRVVLELQDVCTALEEVRIPVLTAIQGGCIGGAVDLVCASDSRYCTEEAFFSIKETQLGMTADVGTLQRLPHLISHGLTRELAYTGRKLLAEEAMQCGLVNKVFKDQDAMLDGVMEIATMIAKNSPLAVAGCKEMINYSRDHSVADSLKYMATWQSGMFRPSHDMMACFTAKTEGKDPEFDELLPKKSLFSE